MIINLAPTKLALAVILTTFIVTLQCCGESKNSTLKSTISKTINLPGLDAELSPGHLFDQATAFSKLTDRVDDDEWHKIPSWMAESWLLDRDKTTASSLGPISADIKNTQVGDKLQMPSQAFAVMPPMSYRTGHYTDATGQTWEYSFPPHWQERDDGKYQHHILVLEQQTTASSDEVYGTFEKRIEFIVDPSNNKIVKILQHARQETRYLLEREPNNNRQNSCTEAFTETFDEHGDLLRAFKSQTYFQSPGRIVADSSLTLPDGRNLFEMFNNYLAQNGMSDRLPKVADLMDKMRYSSPGQTDYSKQNQLPHGLANMPTLQGGPLSGTVEAQGTLEATSFRITDLKGLEKLGSTADKLIFGKIEYQICERKIGARSMFEAATLLNTLHLHPSPSSPTTSIGPGETTILEFKGLSLEQLVTTGLLQPKPD